MERERQASQEGNKRIIEVATYHNGISTIASQYDLILLDLDDVVITPKQYACGSIWHGRYYLKNKHRLSTSQLIKDFYVCPTSHRSVSEELIRNFSDLAGEKKVFGLTSRMIEYKDDTQRQVASTGMKFSDTSSIFHPAIQDGIIFVGYNPTTALPNNKGELLQELISKNYFGNVKSVLFIDDSLKNLQNVKKELSDDIMFTGVHLTAIEAELLCDFNEIELDALAEYQFDFFARHGYMPSNQEYMDHMSQNFTIGSIS